MQIPRLHTHTSTCLCCAKWWCPARFWSKPWWLPLAELLAGAGLAAAGVRLGRPRGGPVPAPRVHSFFSGKFRLNFPPDRLSLVALTGTYCVVLRPAGVEGNFSRSDPPRPKWRPARGPRRPWRRTERDPGVTSPVPFAPLSVGFRSASLRLSVRPAGRPRSLSIGRKGPRGCAERDARFSFGPRLRPGGRLSPDKEPERSQKPPGAPGSSP